MNISTTIADAPLRCATMHFNGMPAGRLAPRGLNALFQVRLDREGLRVPVSPGDSTISRRPIIIHHAR